MPRLPNGDPVNTDTLEYLLNSRPDWHRRAACRGVGPDLFFPGPGHPHPVGVVLCESCPVIDDCRGSDEPYGVWGGEIRRRGVGDDGIAHGTKEGRRQHQVRGVPLCDDCRAARRREDRKARKR